MREERKLKKIRGKKARSWLARRKDVRAKKEEQESLLIIAKMFSNEQFKRIEHDIREEAKMIYSLFDNDLNFEHYLTISKFD